MICEGRCHRYIDVSWYSLYPWNNAHWRNAGQMLDMSRRPTCLAITSAHSHHEMTAVIIVTGALSQQTCSLCITFIQCWTNVEDVGPTLYKCYTNVLCLLGCFWIACWYVFSWEINWLGLTEHRPQTNLPIPAAFCLLTPVVLNWVFFILLKL